MKSSAENKNAAEVKKGTHQNYIMEGEGTRLKYIANGKHVSFTIKDKVTGTKYCFIMFNVNNDVKKILDDNDNFRVSFNIGYNKDNHNNLGLRLVANMVWPL